MTAIDYTGGGDAYSTKAGAILTASPSGGYTLTSLVPGSFTDEPASASATQIDGYPYLYLQSHVGSAGLDYMRFGSWILSWLADSSSGSVFVGGFLTPPASIPTTGTASFTGTASGLYHMNVICSCLDVTPFTGNVSASANFANASLAGSISGIAIRNYNGVIMGGMNDIGFSALIDRSANLFSGSTNVLTSSTGAYAFGSAASGDIRGRFYGPAGQEIGAVFGLSDGDRRLIGSFGARAQP